MNGVVWRKSSRSNTSGGECVEVGQISGVIGVRDSKSPEAGHLLLSVEAFGGLLTRIKAGDLAL
ncbi:DUF397 domain-containing protein [Actinomadura alba]|uniref:DUF397 domain-containing protein n=1 Tax=Actinomadura alba TaxID=406431 RepID=A0ABR7LTH3_9ACTN|nr:DUF397 domain-containing protein [Actinomadura alba]MBC6468151.1 DUF397 domain-containing protein [Actinomadura alba]